MPTTDLPAALAARRDDTEALVVVDHAGSIVLMTPAAEELFGIGLDDIAGEAVELLMAQEFRFGHQAYRRGYISEPADREMDPGLEPHGMNVVTEETFPIHVRLEPVRDDGTLYVIAHVEKLA